MAEDFTWRDGERTIRFADGAAGQAPELLAEHRFEGFTLLTTERTRGEAPAVVDAAREVIHVPPGKVDELSAALLGRADGNGAGDEIGEPSGALLDQADGNGAGDEIGEPSGALLDQAGEGSARTGDTATFAGRPLVALGGGRVVDTAKAIAGVTGQPVATLATTLSGAELTRSHRRPVGVEGAQVIRPALVIADPDLMASAPDAPRAASAMNALAHAMEALYSALANPVCDLAALRAATLLAHGVEAGDRHDLALGAVLAGYACGATRTSLHHAVCQTIVRTAGSPHAETNAVMLPHTARLMLPRAPAALGAFAGALGDSGADPESAPDRLAQLAAHSGHVRLGTLGVEERHVDAIVAAVPSNPLFALTPDPPDADELRRLVSGAL